MLPSWFKPAQFQVWFSLFFETDVRFELAVCFTVFSVFLVLSLEEVILKVNNCLQTQGAGLHGPEALSSLIVQ